MTSPSKSWLLLTEFFPPEPGGIQQALQTVSHWLPADLMVIARPQAGAEAHDRRQSYRIIRRSLFGGPGWPRWGWLIGWLWKRRAIYHLAVFGHFSPAVTAAWILSWLGYRYAILIHGQDLLSETQRPFRRWLVGTMLRRAQWIGANSRFTAGVVHGFGVAQALIIRTHPALDDIWLSRPYRPQAFQMITICRMVPRKNVEMILRALAPEIHRFPKLQYHVIGDGPERSRLEQMSRQLGLSSQVFFHGTVDESKKISLLQTSQLAVMTPAALDNGSQVEGLGIFYLEAAALGIPMIATVTGGVTDIVRDRQTGRLVPPGDIRGLSLAIRELLQDPAEARQYGRAGQELVKHEFLASVRNQRLAWLMDPFAVNPAPKVSVIIPVYNHAATISTTLNSVFQQTWKSMEVILVDDGSTDDLERAVRAWKRNLHFLRQSNQGAPAARNAGARLATGEYLVFVDADIWLDPDFLTRLVQVLETHPEAGFAYSRFRFGPKGFRLHEFSVSQLRRRNYIHTTSLIRRRDFPGFDANLKRFQDWDLWLTMAAQGRTGIFLPAELFRVRQNLGGMRASRWLPRFIYDVPWVGQGYGSKAIRDYRLAERIIRSKHQLFKELPGA